MLLDDPQTRGAPSAVSGAPTSAAGAFASAAGEGFSNTSVGMVGRLLAGMDYKDDQILDSKAYDLSPYARDGQYEQGMTVAQAKVKAAKYDAQVASIRQAGHPIASFSGGLAGGALDPLFYIPYMDAMAPALKAAQIATRGEVLGEAVTQSANAMTAALAEQPLAYATAKQNDQDYDIQDAASMTTYALIGGGFFGGFGAKLRLSVPQKVAGIQKALDDIHMGREVDTAPVVNPAASVDDSVRRALQEGQIPPLSQDMSPEAQRAVQAAKVPRADIENQGVTGDNSSTETKGIISDVRQSILRLREGAPAESENLQGLPQRLHAWMAKNPSVESVAAVQDELQVLRERVPEARTSIEAALQELRQPGQPEASPGLQETTGSRVAVPEVPHGGASADDAAFLESYKKDGGASYYKAKIAELGDRTDVETRKRVDAMSDQEKTKALLTDELTGIPNRRAFQESERMPVQVSTDLDNFKAVNDTMTHEGGDKVLKNVAGVMKEEFEKQGGRVFRLGGDEFHGEAPTKDAANAAMNSVRSRLDRAIIDVELPDGTKLTKKGIGVSYGTGADRIEAEVGLKADKSAREAAGLRTARDIERVATDAAQGDQGDAGSRAAKLAYYKERLAAVTHPEPDWSPAPPKADVRPSQDYSGIPLTDADKAEIAATDAEATKLEDMAKALKVGASCLGL